MFIDPFSDESPNRVNIHTRSLNKIVPHWILWWCPKSTYDTQDRERQDLPEGRNDPSILPMLVVYIIWLEIQLQNSRWHIMIILWNIFFSATFLFQIIFSVVTFHLLSKETSPHRSLITLIHLLQVNSFQNWSWRLYQRLQIHFYIYNFFHECNRIYFGWIFTVCIWSSSTICQPIIW